MTRPVRIYDTFLFDGELDLLEHRLRENFEDTDMFVLVEAGETYRGKPKPLQFGTSGQRFAWARDKLRIVSLAALGPPGATPRARAEVQRNAVLLALHDAHPQDIVLLLDADEIPSISLLRLLRTCGLAAPHRLQMTRHYQKLDLLAPASTCCMDRSLPFSFAADRRPSPAWESPADLWSGRSGVAAPMASMQNSSGSTPFCLRFGKTDQPVLAEAGRHLTATDPSAHLSRKLGRVFHSEWATEAGTYLPHLLRCEQHAVHHRGWWYAERPTGPLPSDLARLAAACPSTRRTTPLPPLWRRRLVRTWAWLRVWQAWPGFAVRFVDRHFEALLPALAMPLLVAGLVRRLLARGLPARSVRKQQVGHASAHAHHP